MLGEMHETSMTGSDRIQGSGPAYRCADGSERVPAGRTRVLPRTRALLFHDGLLYLSRGSRVYTSPDLGQTLQLNCELHLPSAGLSLAGATRLGRRLARASVHRVTVLPDGTRLLIYRGGIYRAGPGSAVAERTHTVDRGSRPISLAHSPSGLVYFGEYRGNPDREEVFIYGSADTGLTWEPVYTFAAGAVRHVHSLVWDRWASCFWITTGDEPGECRVLRASDDFSQVSETVRGDQEARFYRLLPTEQALLTATDTPYAPNAITIIDRKAGTLRRVQDVENSCFGVCQVGSHYFVATTAEPGGGNDCRHSHVWTSTGDLLDWHHCATFSVDWIARLCLMSPKLYGLMQFPRVEFPEGDNPSGRYLVAYCTGMAGLDDSTVVYDIGSAEETANT